MKLLELKNYTTIRTGGKASNILTPQNEKDLIKTAIQNAPNKQTLPLILGQGSNLIFSDNQYTKPIIKPENKGYKIVAKNPKYYIIEGYAGENWDHFVATTLKHELSGLETLSGIPGTIGAAPIQNIGAYGNEISQHIETIRCWDQQNQQIINITNNAAQFGYRTSILKNIPNRYLILSVTFKLKKSPHAAQIRYPELAQKISTTTNTPPLANTVRKTVLKIRATKGMILNPTDPNTYSVGSFFINPIIPNTQTTKLPNNTPKYPQPNNKTKISAAWLIEQAGFNKGYGATPPNIIASGRASISTKHTLALTNHNNATTQDILNLAAIIRQGVYNKFGILLQPEPTLIECTIPNIDTTLKNIQN